MDINKAIQELKQREGFADHVGMMLIHNGVVRSWSRQGHETVTSVSVRADKEKMHAICQEIEQRQGIFAVVAHAQEGEFKPGDDLLYLIVAGDIRENVKTAFADLLDRIKAESIIKQEFLA